AGGLAVREQSSQFQGSSFAGAAAGGGLSSAFWNSAAIGEAGNGMQTENHAALIFGETDYTSVAGTGPGFIGISTGVDAGDSVTNDRIALVPSSYMSYRLNDKTVLGMAINAPFGLGNELDDPTSAFAIHHRSAKLFTLNANPMMSYEVMKGVYFGVGVQVQYASLSFKTAGGVTTSAATAVLDGDDIGFGFTAGVLLKPSPGTSIGIGFRSAIEHEIEGDQFTIGTGPKNKFQLDVDTPELVTLSIRQALSPNLRLLGTVEWQNWEHLDIHPIIVSGQPIGSFDFQWDNGWFFSLGAEYDYSPSLTLRGGIAYEISPIQNASQRLPQVPDSDRIWLSFGGTYKYSEMMSFDFAYTHIFFDDATLDREPASDQLKLFDLVAETESKADIFTASVKIKWGEGGVLGLFQ
ncbi:MAG: outer membrane protein transport protein, partial [Pseudomonadota bacterium]